MAVNINIPKPVIDYNDLDNKPTLVTAHSELNLDDGTNPHGTTASDVGALPMPNGTTSEYLRGDGSVATFPTIPSITGLVPETRTINGLDLSANRTLTAGDVGAVATNTPITGATKTKITYDAKGLVTAGADATTADIADSTNKRYVTDAQQTVIGNTSGTNTGDNFAIIGGSQFINTGTGGSDRFIHPYTAALGTQENVRQIVIPCLMTISKFFIQTGQTQSATGSHVLTLRKNGVDTSVQVTIPAGSASGVFSDTANSVTFNAGDLLGIRMINNASTSAGQIQSMALSN